MERHHVVCLSEHKNPVTHTGAWPGGKIYLPEFLMAACGATIHSGGTTRRNNDFCVRLAFTLKFAVQGLVRVAIKVQIPVKAVLGRHDLHHEGLQIFH